MSTARVFPALVAAVALASGLSACAGASARFPPDVATAVMQSSMRTLETDELVVYYPEGARSEAERTASRIEACTKAMRALAPIKSDWSTQKLHVTLPPLPYNNAYVAAPAGIEPIAVVPTVNTEEIFELFGLPPDPGNIGCHEATHYVHELQAGGFHNFTTLVFGPAYTPQIGLDPWFWEGLAVYYETKLQGGFGRLGTRYFEGILAAGTAETGIDTGMLHAYNRRPIHGAQYLIGSAFVDWLAAREGEPALWKLIEKQGRAFFFPFGVESRFKGVYGESLTSLVKDFAADLEHKYPKRAREPAQRVQFGAGTDARYARARTGHEALITVDYDRPSRLVVRDPQGAVLFDRNLADVLPGRTLTDANPGSVSGLSFTRDGRSLWFVVADRGSLFNVSKLVRFDLESGDLSIVAGDLRGAGGSIAPDGRTYYFARAYGDAWGLAAIDVATKRVSWLRGPEAGVYQLGARVSPDGTKLVVTRTDGTGFWLAVVDAKTGAILREPTPHDGFAISADWADDDRIVYVADAADRMQVHVTSVSTGTTTRATNAPYLALWPQAQGNVVRFLNRDGWRWTVDEAPLPAPPGAANAAAPPARDPLAERSYAAESSVNVGRPPLRITRDEPYSTLDGLFVPRLRSPWLVSRGDRFITVGLGAMGGDRLGAHRWGIAAGYELQSHLVSGAVQYLNTQLSPLWIGLEAAHYAAREAVTVDNQLSDRLDPVTQQAIDVHESTGRLFFGRTFYGATSVETGARFDELLRTIQDGTKIDVRRFAGTYASLVYAAAESTAYTGPRRAFAAGMTGTLFPKIWKTQDFAIGDGAAEIAAVIPVAFDRLVLDLDARGRYLAGVPRGTGLLQIGGGGGTIGTDVKHLAPIGVDQDLTLPPGLRFYEGLAGYEDLARYDRGAAIGEASLRYPLIIDWGSVSSFYVFPSFLLREIWLGAFASGATFVDTHDRSAAVGGRLTIATAFWNAPISFRVQVAQRLADDEHAAVYFTVAGQ